MEKIKVKIIDKIGLHARPAAYVIKQANKFKCDIEIYYNKKKADMKSIMNVMLLAIPKDAKIEIVANGNDEKKAIKTIFKSLKKKKII